MLIGTVDHNMNQQNPYAIKIENSHTKDAISKVDDASKAELQKSSDAANEPHDEYIPSDDKSGKSPGIYQSGKDESGRQKIVFDRPDSQKKGEQAGTVKKTNGSLPEDAPEKTKNDKNYKKKDGPGKVGDKKHGLWCTVSTDKVDAEIKKLKAEKQQIEQQLRRTDDADKRRTLEKQLSQIESELSAKDNDAYRKQHATYTYSAAR